MANSFEKVITNILVSTNFVWLQHTSGHGNMVANDLGRVKEYELTSGHGILCGL